MALLHGRAGRLTYENGGSRPARAGGNLGVFARYAAEQAQLAGAAAEVWGKYLIIQPLKQILIQLSI
jgi:hypothetical protein